jgi:DNA repair protein RadD
MLRDFQQKMVADVHTAWAEGARNIMMVAPTGSGKTVVFCDILKRLAQPAVVIAHRSELVGQAALALNRENVPHAIIAPAAIQQQIIALEMDTHGHTFYSPDAPVKVAGVDTLIRRDGKDRWYGQVQTVVVDEAHHLVQNKWADALHMFPNARGLFPTAHAIRADGKGLGRNADGFVDRLVIGPSCRDLIVRGFLTDYRIVCPPSDVDVSNVPISSTGDFSNPKLRAAVHKSKTIVGDIVGHYLKFARGKLGVTFAVDIESANEIAEGYVKAGISASIITGNTPLYVRGQLMRQFRARRLLQLVSVDVLGEGVDVPAIEVVSLGRHTNSFQLFAQQIGRALRIMVSDEDNARWDTFTDQERLARIAASVKPKALIIDHVGNIGRFYQVHRFPCSTQNYSLDRVEKRSRGKPDDAIPLRVCMMCLQPYEAFLDACPHCGHVSVPQRRGSPNEVEGNLIELDPSVLALMRGELKQIDGPSYSPRDVDQNVAMAIHHRHRERQKAQATLRRALMLWGGWQDSLGRSISEAQRIFWFCYGVDVMSAQLLGATEATALEARVRYELAVNNIVEQIE